MMAGTEIENVVERFDRQLIVISLSLTTYQNQGLTSVVPVRP